MARTDHDSWDLASSVGRTATGVAAARALAARGPDPLIDDPYAEPLVRAVGLDGFTRMLAEGPHEVDDDPVFSRQQMAEQMTVRTRFFDDFFTTAGEAGIRQAVILASGLDTRAYRLPWPLGTVVYEIDQPQVIEFKNRTLSDLGAAPTAELRTIGIDLRQDWAAALRGQGFDTTEPTAWSAEGLLAYLPPEAQDRLFDELTELSAPGSRLATEYHPDGGASIGERASAINAAWADQGFSVNLADLFYPGERQPVVDYLAARGWQVQSRTRPEVFAHYGRDFGDSEVLAAMRNSLSVTAERK